MNNSEQNSTKQLDYLVATLLDFFRDPHSEDSYLHAAQIALDQLSFTAAQHSAPSRKRFVFFASKLKNNLTPQSIRFFSTQCIEAAQAQKNFTQSSQSLRDPSAKTLRKYAAHELSSALSNGHSQEAAIHRTAFMLAKKKRSTEAQKNMQQRAQQHPLRETFGIFDLGHKKLAKEDVKNHLLHLDKGTHKSRTGSGILFQLLKKAQAFSIHRLHQLLGDELFFLCRPLGFVDQNGTTVLIEVPTSAHLNVLTYKKLEILTLLRKDETFYSTKSIRFTVKSNNYF